MIIGFAVIPSILCSLASVGIRVPVVVCERNDPGVYPLLWKLIRSVAYKFASGAVFQTNDASNYFGDEYFKVRKIIYNPLQLDNFKSYEFSTANKKNSIVITSRLTEVKNHEILIRAFALLTEKFPDYILDIYGDGPLRDYLTNLVKKLGLDNKVVFHGAMPDVLNKIVSSKIFVLPSNHEGFPNSLAEAMALGIPSISTDCRIGGPKEMIVNGVNGIFIPINDLEALTHAIEALIEDNVYYAKIACNSIEIRNMLDAKKISSEWIQFIEEILLINNNT